MVSVGRNESGGASRAKVDEEFLPDKVMSLTCAMAANKRDIR